MTRFTSTALLALGLLLGSPAAAADEVAEKEPDPKRKGEVYAWKSKDGLAYLYRVPTTYHEGKGVNLTLILHGSNLDRRWGFANHSAKTFRPDDLVVSPDGTTANGQGGFNFLGERKDVNRLVALIEELKERFTIRRVYVYGHSQGSFFAFYLAGEKPDLINGVVGHASGVWSQTQGGKRCHHQAIALMHGTEDPVVPYGQSVGGYDWFAKQDYPSVRLVSLEGWNHWPAEHNSDVPHTSQQIAWLEGMTEDDPARLEASLSFLLENKSKERHDYAALWHVARHIAEQEALPEGLRKKAAAARDAVEALATDHASALPEPTDEFDKKGWVAHLPLFLRAFGGVPARETTAEAWAKVLEKHEKAADKHMRKYWQAVRKPDVPEAFEAGIDAVENAFLAWSVHTNREMITNLETWKKEAKKHDLPKKALARYDKVVEPWVKAWTDGVGDFDATNRKARLP
jgi:poly(3-hydroxybutyrate) depolymerase